MAQHDYNIANASFPTVRSDINDVLSAINSSNSGASRPSSAVAGTIWLDTSGAATAQLLKLYDGAADITLATVNFTANTVDFQDSDAGGVTFKEGGTNFSNSLLIGHSTTGTLNSASDNIGIGVGSLDALTSGDSNVSLGVNAGTSITSGTGNMSIGKDAAATLSTTSQNVLIGSSAGYYVTGGSNIGIGHRSAHGASGANGDYNVAIGASALDSLTSGDNNIGIGKDAGDNITSGSGNVVIGVSDVASATGDDQLSISDGEDGSVVWISGDSAGTVSANGGHLTTTGKALVFGF